MNPYPSDTCCFCRSKLTGQKGSRRCSNINCASYEVNEHNYELSRKERKDLKEDTEYDNH